MAKRKTPKRRIKLAETPIGKRPEVPVLPQEKSQDTTTFDGGNARMQPKPIGASGTELYSGYFSEEYLQKLRGRRGAKVYDQMRRSEAQVSMILNVVNNAIKSGTWDDEAADEELVPDAELHRDFIRACRTEMIDWEAHLHEALTLDIFGYSLFEVIHQVIFDHPKFGTINGLKGLAFRSQKTIERWIVDDNTGELSQVEQWVQGDLAAGNGGGQAGAIRKMDAQHLLVMTMGKEGDNYEGISLLRPMYGAFFRKDLYLKILAMGLEQNAKGTVVGTVPAGMNSDDEEVVEFKKILQNYVAHESSYMLKPEGWEITVTNHDFDASKVKDIIAFENEEMARAACANFLALGMSGTGGAYALGSDLSDIMLSGIVCIADIVRGVWNRVLIPNLIKLNYGEQPAYPKLTVSNINDKAGKELAEILKSFADGKIIKPDDTLEENLRKRYNLPKADPTTARDTTPPSPFGGGAPAPGQDPNKPVDPNADPTKVPPAKDPNAKPVVDPKAKPAVDPNADPAKADPTKGDPTKLSEERIKLAESYPAQWKDSKESLKGVMQTGLENLLDGYKTSLRKSWANATAASKPGLALKLQPTGLNNYKAALREELARIANLGLARARAQTPWLKDKKIKLAESIQLKAPAGGFYDALPTKIKRLIKANADLIAETQNTDIAKLVSFQYGNSMQQDNIDQIINDIDNTVTPVIEGSTGKGMSVDTAAGNATSQSMQQARMEFFFEPEVLASIASMTYVNAEPVSEICQALVGTTLSIDDPQLDTYATPLHHNCDGEWVPNEAGADGNPDIKRGQIPLNQKQIDSMTLCECAGHGLNLAPLHDL